MKEFYRQYVCLFCILLDVGEYLLVNMLRLEAGTYLLRAMRVGTPSCFLFQKKRI
jgi:hypothetical protein